MNRLDTTKEEEDLQISIFRKMRPEKRLQMGLDLARIGRKLLEARVSRRHPGYSEEEIRLAVIGLILGGPLSQEYEGFGLSDLGHFLLPFDFAQDGEPVEPFRISCFEIWI